MKLLFEHKKPGRRRRSIEPVLLDLNSKPATVGSLIEETVRSCVEAYNAKAVNAPGREELDADSLHSVIGSQSIEDLAETGRIAFGMVYTDKIQDPEKAVANALQCYDDGLFRIFLNGKPLGGKDDSIQLNECDLLTVVRLTMLAGRLW